MGMVEDRNEEINHPDRYKSGGFECIDIMVAVFGKEAVKWFSLLNALSTSGGTSTKAV